MDKFLEEFAKLGAQQKIAGLVGAVIAIIAASYYGGIADTLELIDEQAETIESQEAQLVKLEVQARDRSRYMKEVARLKQRLREAEEQLPKKAEVPKLLRDISYEAPQSGLQIARFEVQDERKQGEFAKVPVSMRVTGSYHEIAVFFDRLSKMSRIVNVADLKMTSPQFINKKIVLTSSFDATTYRFLENGK